MPGAQITLTLGKERVGLIAAEGLLLTLTDPEAETKHRDRAAQTARHLLKTRGDVEIAEAASTIEIARALSTYIQEVATTSVQPTAARMNQRVQQKGGAVDIPNPTQRAKVKAQRDEASGAQPGGNQPANGDFEKQHPRGRGGVWIKKGDGYQGQQGGQGEPKVAQLQRRLQQLGYGPGAPDGKFGDLTAGALAKFQADYGLQGTGQELDPATLQVLQNPPAQKLADVQAQNRADAQMANAQGEAPKASAASASTGATARSTSTQGTEAQVEQTLDTSDVNAVRAFQEKHGLTVDGVVGPNTLAMMKGAGVKERNVDGTVTTETGGASAEGNKTGGSAAPASAERKAKPKTKTSPMGKSDLKLGMGVTGNANAAVKTIQKALDQLGYDPGGVDGRFGPDTKKAIQKLQRKYGLKADGVVGARTKRLIERLLKRQGKKAGSDKLKSADEEGLFGAGKVSEAEVTAIEIRLQEAVDHRIEAERSGDVEAFIEARAHEVTLRESLLSKLKFDPKLHPRDRRGSFRDAPDIPTGTHVKWAGLSHHSGVVQGRATHGPDRWLVTDEHGNQRTVSGDKIRVPERLGMADPGIKGSGMPNIGDDVIVNDEGTVAGGGDRTQRTGKVKSMSTTAFGSTQYVVRTEEGDELTVFANQVRGTKVEEAAGPIFDSSKTHVGDYAPGGRLAPKPPRNRVGEFADKPKKKKRKLVTWSKDKPYPHYVYEGDAPEEIVMDHLPTRLTEAAAAREQATPGTPEHTEARAREVEIAHQMMEGKALSAEERKRSATIIRKKGDATEHKFPIPDKNHAKAALAYLNKSDLSDAEKAKVRAKAKSKLKEARADEDAVEALDYDDVVMVEMLLGEAMGVCPECGGKLKDGRCSKGHKVMEADTVEEAIEEAAGSLVKASTHKHGLESKKGDRDNWVERSGSGGRGGQLPAYIQHIALAIHRKRGMPKSQAIAIAIGTVKRWARGSGDVDAETRAAAAKALGEWEAMKAKNKAKKVAEAEQIEEGFGGWLKKNFGDQPMRGPGGYAPSWSKTYKNAVAESALKPLVTFNPNLHPRNRVGEFIDVPGAGGRVFKGRRSTEGLPGSFRGKPGTRRQPVHNPGPNQSSHLHAIRSDGRTGKKPDIYFSAPGTLPGKFERKPTGVKGVVERTGMLNGRDVTNVGGLMNARPRTDRTNSGAGIPTGAPPEPLPGTPEYNAAVARRNAMDHERYGHTASWNEGRVTQALGGKDNLTPDPPDYTDQAVLAAKPINELARIAQEDWGTPSFAARPYLDAMAALGSPSNDDNARAEAVINAFLMNAQGWKGPVAKAVKRELAGRLASRNAMSAAHRTRDVQF